MGNAHVVGIRIGCRANEDAPVEWHNDALFRGHEGVAPCEIVAEAKIDKTLKLSDVEFKWISEDTVAAPENHVIATVRVPVAMETLTTQCSLPNAWPPGKYRVDFMLAGQLAGSIPFQVEQTEQVASCRMYFQRTPDSSKQEFVDVFSPDAGELFVVFKTSFLADVREDSYITWVAKDVPEMGPADLQLLKLDLEHCKANVFDSQIAIECPWAAGTYEVSLVLDGELIFSKQLECVDDNVAFTGELLCSPAKGGKKEVQASRVLAPDCGEIGVRFSSSRVVNVKDNVIVRWMHGQRAQPTPVAKVIFPGGKYDTVRSESSMPEGKVWPAGPYWVEVLLDGKKTTELEFAIE